MPLSQLRASLLDFERQPGRFALVRREPAILFEQAHTVLQLAAGRPVQALAAMATHEQEQLRSSARFFVRMAFLRVGVDHYTLLGLRQSASDEQVREHYRLMIRMTHPDFAVSGEHWPMDSAARINMAHDVLSEHTRRHGYDQALQAAQPGATAAAAPQKPLKRARVQAWRARLGRRQNARSRWSTRGKGWLATAGALVCLGALVGLNSGNHGSLTVRERTVADDTATYAESGFSLRQRPAPEQVPAPVPKQQHKQQQHKQQQKQESKQESKQPGAARNPIARDAAADGLPSVRVREKGPLREVVAANASPTSAGVPAAAVVSSEPLQPRADAHLAEALTKSAWQVGAVKNERMPLQAVKAEPTQAVAVAPRLTAQAVHPLMTNVLSSLSDGDGESLAQWIAPEWRGRPGNQAFVSRYNQWLDGQRVQEVSKLALTSHAQGETLVVDGVVQLGVVQALTGPSTRRLRLRAYFQWQDGEPVLTQLTASEAP